MREHVRPEANIRDALERDARALAELARESAEAHVALNPRFYRVPDAAGALDRVERQLADTTRRTLVAVIGSQIVGMVDLTPLPPPSIGSMVRPVRAVDVGIVVSAAHRGHGIGRALLEAAESQAARDGVELLTLNAWAGNEAAIGLYRSVGFEQAGALMHRWIA